MAGGFPTFALLMAAELAPRPSCSELRQKQLDEARQAIKPLTDALICDWNPEANLTGRMAIEQYVELVTPFLPVANPDSTAATRALAAVMDFASRHRIADMAPGGMGTASEDYLPHLLYALAALDCAMDRAIRSQPEPTIAA